LPGIATRFFPKSIDKKNAETAGFERWFWRMSAQAVVFICFISVILVYAFSDIKKPTHLAIIVLFAASSAIFALLTARAQGKFQYQRLAIASLLFMAAAVVGFSTIANSPNLLSIFLILTLSNFTASAVLSWGNLPDQDDATAPMTKSFENSVVHYGKNAWIVAVISSLLWARGELPLVEGYLGKDAVGYYAIGLTICGIINQGVSLLSGALWPQIARTWDSGEKTTLMRFEAAVTNILILVAGLAIGFVICFAPHVVLILFGDKYARSTNIIYFLAIGALGLSSGCSNLIVQAATNGKFGRNANLIGVATLIGLAAILTPRFGVEGAALARATVQIGIAGATFVAMLRILHTSAARPSGLYSFVAILFLITSLSAIRISAPALPLIAEVGLFACYAALAWGVCLALGRTRVLEEIQQLKKI
jgi:O-antigen/teichoic acid export membrane protein